MLTAKGKRMRAAIAAALYRPPAELVELDIEALRALWLAVAKLP